MRVSGEHGLGSLSTPYWDGVARHWAAARPHRLWRSYCDRINAALCEAWLPATPVARALKTDLFDEASTGDGLCRILATRARSVVGIDVSPSILQRARVGQPAQAVGADVRRLPFADESFDLVLSNSTLDHFATLDEVATALAELCRVLKPGGQLVLTLDNLANPAVAVRNALPASWLIRLRLVPYYVGATCGPRRLGRLVRQAGLEPLEMGTVMHCPRLPAVLAAQALDRFGSERLKGLFLRTLTWWEALGALPTRYWTGYFLVMKAVRPRRPAMPA
jgi:SAM-dependent methyltransferase